MIGAGFFSSYLYRKRSGQPLTLRSGAHIGWITGVFAFVIIMVIVTMVVVFVSDPNGAAMLREQLKARGADAQVSMVDAMRRPDVIVGALIAYFLSCSILPTLGGLLGAKLLSRHQ